MGDVVMPRLSDSMEEGTILKWLRSSGDQINRGDELVEIETDKATMTYEADSDGVLEIVAGVGDTLAIGAVIARLGVADTPAPSPDPAPAPAPSPDPAPAPASPPATTPTPTLVSIPAQPGERVKASPVAKRIAHERGVELSGLAGSGPGGRIVRADVEGAQTADAPVPVAPTDSLLRAKGETTIVELSKTQQLVARRMASSKATVPEFLVSTDIDMERCVELRARLRQLDGDRGVVPSYNDMIVKACALALREHPRANGSYKDGQFELYSRVNVGVAVAATDSLVVPTVFDADILGIAEIAAQTRSLAEQVRAATITPPQLSGGTFTVSNLGMFGVSFFTAIINAPQAAILAVGAMTPTPVAREGSVVIRQMMSVTLSCDHRILYGADAARFLARIRELLEEPLTLLL